MGRGVYWQGSNGEGGSGPGECRDGTAGLHPILILIPVLPVLHGATQFSGTLIQQAGALHMVRKQTFPHPEKTSHLL